MPKKETSEAKKKTKAVKETAATKPAIIPSGDGIMCPSCGKFVGGYERCPHCQAVMEKRLPILYVRRIAVIGTIIGLIMMWFAAVNKEIPHVKIGDIHIENNMALVKIIGKVTKVTKRDNNFTFKIEDSTGKMSLSGFDKLKRFEKHFGNDFPSEGDEIASSGNLNISEKFGVSMFLANPKRMIILEKFNPTPTTIENIDTDAKGDVLSLRAKIVESRKLKKKGGDETFAHVVSIKDNTGKMELTIFENDRFKIQNKDIQNRIIQVGNTFDLIVMVDEYKGRINLKLRNPGDDQSIKLVSGPQSVDAKIKIGQIRDEMIDEQVEITGKIVAAKTFEFGTSIDIEDDSGKVNVWLPTKTRNFVKNLEAVSNIGNTIRVKGIVKKFKDKLQVTPSRAEEISILNGVAIESAVEVKAASLIDDMFGKKVKISGKVDSAKEFEFGLISINLMDDTGIVNVVIKKQVIPLLKDKTFLESGTMITVTGKVDRYKDKLQVILLNPDNLIINR